MSGSNVVIQRYKLLKVCKTYLPFEAGTLSLFGEPTSVGVV